MPEPYLQRDGVTLYAGDCLDVLRELPDASVDAVVTDPPYNLSFMGRDWDSHASARAFQQWCELWAAECLRVLKPGGHMLAFGGTRTWHRLACAVEDAGFEIRDSIAWLYGSGFPKSLDVSKAIDKRPGVQRHREFASDLWGRRQLLGLTTADVSEAVVGTRSGACWNWEHHQFPEAKWWPKLKEVLHLDDKWDDVIAEAERQKVGERTTGIGTGRGAVPIMGDGDRDITAPATPDAERWQGWGTALKPSHESIVVARRPLIGTVAQNVLTHGTGALNIDACRIEMSEADRRVIDNMGGFGAAGWDGTGGRTTMNASQDGSFATWQGATAHVAGRWPANVVLDERHEPVLRLKYNLPSEVERTIRESFGASTSHLPAVRSNDHGAAEPEDAAEVLQRQMPRSVDVGQPAWGARAEIRQATHGRVESEDVEGDERPSASRTSEPTMDGWDVPDARLRHGSMDGATSAGPGCVRADDGRESDAGRLRPRASANGSPEVGPTDPDDGARSPHQRCEGRQPAGESRGALERGSQADARRGGAGAIPAARRELHPAPAPLDVLRRECPPGWWHYFDIVGHRREGQADALDQQGGDRRPGERPAARGITSTPGANGTMGGGWSGSMNETREVLDSGGASRFYYVAKAPASERPRYWAHDCVCPHDKPIQAHGVCDVCGTPGKLTAHATVKPLALMRWLVRLVTPPGGTVLEPFSGSGTTIEACLLEGYRCVAVEKEADYLPLIESRIARQRDPVRAVELSGADAGLFEFITDEEDSA